MFAEVGQAGKEHFLHSEGFKFFVEKWVRRLGGVNIGALTSRIGFCDPLYYKYNHYTISIIKNPPK